MDHRIIQCMGDRDAFPAYRKYPFHDHIHGLFRGQAVRHERLHLPLVHAPDGRFMGHLRQRMGHRTSGTAFATARSFTISMQST